MLVCVGVGVLACARACLRVRASARLCACVCACACQANKDAEGHWRIQYAYVKDTCRPRRDTRPQDGSYFSHELLIFSFPKPDLARFFYSIPYLCQPTQAFGFALLLSHGRKSNSRKNA